MLTEADLKKMKADRLAAQKRRKALRLRRYKRQYNRRHNGDKQE